MTPAKAILYGAALIAASIVFVNTNSSVFRINTANGEVSGCYIPGGANSTEVACTKPVR